MSKFVILMKLTEKGAQDFDGALKDIDATRADMRGPHEIKEVTHLVTLGRIDLLMVIEAFSAELAGYYAVQLAKHGYVLTETLPAFDSPLFGEVITTRGHITHP